MQIQRLVDLEDYEFDTLLVTYNHKTVSYTHLTLPTNSLV